MNAKQLISLAALAIAAGSALADDITPDHSATAVSSRTRASVKAEVLQARAAGELLSAGDEDFGATAPRSTLARATVKADVLAARANDELMPAGELAAVAHPVPRHPGLHNSAVALAR